MKWMGERVWKVGELADDAGLTIRTLHHYDRIGLVRAAKRTGTGHRLYTEADVQRLYQVLALRQLGLGLDKIAELLAGTVTMAQVLLAHRECLANQLAATHDLHSLVAALVTTVERQGPATADHFLELIRRTVMVDNTVKQYFTQQQLAQLSQRREQLGEQHHQQVQAGWAELIPQVDAAIAAGVEPTSPQGQQLAARWAQLLEEFHGGDAGLRDSLLQMHADHADRIERESAGPSAAHIEFVNAANAAQD
ncbi:MerR family transcriptional regulator [Nocardia brasiliensis]|uniref:Albicidin resistance domain-containing protein n=1 Tax=Nocardia brasiliensis (strain ATCC 700358 / HUJEG-1) TaxID=1133849 RepID=K0F008_NOCB7|nr:MerR family transcriptional regulator [Nocardia brasiliensis]AFU02674.1 albicidin resistance domain-containing protein [Nocardia brasiliensis ATCC 700358]OCF85646.1 MerR family transcriptional regulator [Nocardia brasiliensis]